MALNQVLRLEIIAQGPSGEMLAHILHYAQSEPTFIGWTIADVQTVSAVLDGAIAPVYMAIASSNITYDQTVVTLINAGLATGLQAINFLTRGTTGGTAGADGSIERSLVIRKRTNFIGRKNRGRNFWAAPCRESFNLDGSYVPGNPDAAAQNALLGVLDDDIVVPGVTTLSPVVCDVNGAAFNRVNSTDFSPLVGIQRRRRIGIGA